MRGQYGSAENKRIKIQEYLDRVAKGIISLRLRLNKEEEKNEEEYPL
jgi:hypothetical protein